MADFSRRGFLVFGAAALLGGCSASLGPLVESGASTPESLTPDKMVALVNSVRRANGQRPWTWNAQLAAAARVQANLMAAQDTLSHDLGKPLRQRTNDAGYKGAVAENVGGGQKTLEQVLAAWLGSDGHRRTLLSPKFTEFGLAVARTGRKSRMGVYWSLIAGGPTEAWVVHSSGQPYQAPAGNFFTGGNRLTLF